MLSPACTEGIPPVYWIPSTVLKLFPTVLKLSPTVLKLSPTVLKLSSHMYCCYPPTVLLLSSHSTEAILHSTEAILHCTEAIPHSTEAIPTVLKLSLHNTDIIPQMYWTTSTVLNRLTITTLSTEPLVILHNTMMAEPDKGLRENALEKLLYDWVNCGNFSRNLHV